MRKKTIRNVTAFIAILPLAGALAGCGSSNGSGGNGDGSANSGPANAAASGGSDKQQSVEVTLMTWESAEMNDKIMASMKKFEQDTPGITVKLIPTPLDN